MADVGLADRLRPKWKYLCNIYSSEALYDRNNLICASDAVTYAVFTELKSEGSSTVSCTYRTGYFWNDVAVIFSYFCKFAFALLAQLLHMYSKAGSFFVVVEGIWPSLHWCSLTSRCDSVLWEGGCYLIMLWGVHWDMWCVTVHSDPVWMMTVQHRALCTAIWDSHTPHYVAFWFSNGSNLWLQWQERAQNEDVRLSYF